MKIRRNFLVRKILGEYIGVSVDPEESDRNVMMKMNKTGKDIWDCIQEGMTEEEIADYFVENYADVTREQALEFVQDTIAYLTGKDVLE